MIHPNEANKLLFRIQLFSLMSEKKLVQLKCWTWSLCKNEKKKFKHLQLYNIKKNNKKNNLHTEIVFHRHHYKLVACKLENYLILPFLVQCQVCIHGIMPLRDAVACGGACPQEYFFAHTTLVCCSTALTSPLLLFSWYAAHIKRCAPAQDSLES